MDIEQQRLIGRKMIFPRIFALSCLVALSGCVPTKTDMLRAHAWACGNDTRVVFDSDGVLTTSLVKTGAQPIVLQSNYKIVDSKTDSSMYLDLSDDKALRPIFGGIMVMTPLHIGFSDGYLLIKPGGVGDFHPCEAIK